MKKNREQIFSLRRFILIPNGRVFLILLILLIVFSASSCTYQDDEFSFSAPLGFKTKQYKTSDLNPQIDHNLLIFSQKGHLYFQVIRQKIPLDRDLETIFNEYKDQSSARASHYQFISQTEVEINDRPAIEYVHREFLGEPYEQISEIWMEYNGWVYSLVCTDPVVSTPGEIIPVSEVCIRLVEGFQFK
jgi:hypothetical protein